MPNFNDPIEEIAQYIDQEVYLKPFPIVESNSEENPEALNRAKVMDKSPYRVIHGFDNANRSAELLPK